jgi:hypothetical protein
LVSVKPLEKLSAKIDDMKESLDKLAPLAPVADQLASVPAKVVTLQSAAFENSEQIRALNLALIRVEKAQRDGKGLALEETSDANHASEPPKGPGPRRRPIDLGRRRPEIDLGRRRTSPGRV